MANSMRVDLETGGVAEGVRGLRDMASALRAVSRAQAGLKADTAGLEKLVAGLNQVAGGYQAVSAAQGGVATVASVLGRQGSGGSRVSGGQARPAGGPNAAVARARAQLDLARQGGTAEDVQDALFNLNRAQGRLDRINNPPPPPSFLQRLGSAALTSRFNIGGQSGGVSPLVGRSLNALGIRGEGAGAVGLMAGGAALAATALRALASEAQAGGAAIRALGATATLSGGTTAQASRLQALGISADAASSVRNNLATNPLAMLAGAQIGVRATPYEFGGNQNDAQVILSILDGLKKVNNEQERLRLARMLEVQQYLPLLHMSDRARKSLLATADALAKISDPKTVGAAADLEAANRRINLSMDGVRMALTKAIGPDMTRAANWFADSMSNVAKWLDANQKNIQTWIAGILAGLTGGTFKPNPVNAGTSANTNAINNNTKAVNNLSGHFKGVSGGGARAAGALPSGLTGMRLNQASQNNAMRLNYWTL